MPKIRAILLEGYENEDKEVCVFILLPSKVIPAIVGFKFI